MTTPPTEPEQAPVVIAVIGAADATPAVYQAAFEVGRLLGAEGAVVATGGRHGVMEAASHGARSEGAVTLGILPGDDPEDSPPNAHVLYPIYTGLGDARNAVLVRTARAVIAVGGGFGTLSEIGLALKAGRPVFLLDSWGLSAPHSIEGMERLLRCAASPAEAVSLALAAAGQI